MSDQRSHSITPACFGMGFGTVSGQERAGWRTVGFAVLRYNANGTLDESFDDDSGTGNGKFTTDFGSNDIGRAMAIQPDYNVMQRKHRTWEIGMSKQSVYGASDANWVEQGQAVSERLQHEPYGRVAVAEEAGQSGDAWHYLHEGLAWDGGVAALHRFRHCDYSPSLGRWVQQDPMGYVDGMSLYEYVRSGPIDGTDPLGLRSYLEATGNDITVVVRVHFFWDECDSRFPADNTLQEAKKQAAFHAKSAQDWWSDMFAKYEVVQRQGGQLTSGKINFRLEHKFTVINSEDAIKSMGHRLNVVNRDNASRYVRDNWNSVANELAGGEEYHQILLHPGGKDRASWASVNRVVDGPNTSVPGVIHWTGTDATTFSHEVGHLMGLKDHYNNKTGKPVAGWPPAIMSDGKTKQVTAGQVQAVLETLNYTELPGGSFGVVAKGTALGSLNFGTLPPATP